MKSCMFAKDRELIEKILINFTNINYSILADSLFKNIPTTIYLITNN